MSNFSHIFHSLWSQGQFRKLVLTIFDHIWRGLWWVWCSLILGGFIVGIVISVITTGTSGLADPNKWVIIHLLITHPFYTIIGLIVLSLISLLAYFAHHYQYSASQKNQHLHNEALVDIAKGVRTAIEVLGARSEESLLPLKKDTSNPAKINISPIWNVPYHRNPFFTGRENILKILHDRLSKDKPMALTQSQAINGLGGIGKTETAIEYAYRYQKNYRFIIWARAESQETLNSDFMKIAELLELSEIDTKDHNVIIAAVKNWLATNDDWLLILDNADNLPMLIDFLPTRHVGHIILTTRSQATGTLAQSIEIEKMNPDDGALFLLRRAKIIVKDAILDDTPLKTIAREISQLLDGLPLALDQAGAYIEETGCSLSQYLNIYKERHALLLERRGEHLSNHPEPVSTTWLLTIEKIKQNNPLAVELLSYCAFLYPDAIPEEVLIECTKEASPNSHLDSLNSLELNDAIGVLRKYSLVRRNSEDNFLSVHRLVQVIVKDRMSSNEQSDWAEQVVKTINRIYPDTNYKPWSLAQKYFPQVQICMEHIKIYQFSFIEAAWLLNQAAHHFKNHASYNEAEPLYFQAIAILESIQGPKNPDKAVILNNLADLYYAQGRYTQAESVFFQALAIKDNQSPLISNNLAKLFIIQGKYVQAEPLLLQALSDHEKSYGMDDIDLAGILINLGHLFRIQGKYDEAEQAYIRTLSIQEQHLDSGHPKIAIVLNNLARLYRTQKKYAEAEPLYLRALSIREATLGPDHPVTAITLNNLAMLYVVQSKYDQAESLYLRAIATFERAKGPNHPEIASFINNLAKLYYRQGKFIQAEPLYLRALTLREKILGPEHPDIANILNNLALLYTEQKKHTLAETYYLRALTIQESVFGPKHPSTITFREDYAHFLQKAHGITSKDDINARIQLLRSIYKLPKSE